jgi:hypothetical protein
MKNSSDLLHEGRRFWDSQLVLEWAQLAAVVGLVPQLGAGAVEGQNPQVVHVKGSEVAGDLVVEYHGWPRGVQQQQHHQLQVPWMTKQSPQSWLHKQRWQISWSTPAHAEPWLAL